MSKWRVIAPAMLICAANVYADCADCEAYKTQVASDCDSIISSCDSAIFDCQTAASSAQVFAAYYGSNTTERAALIQVAESASRASGTLATLKTFAQSIKSTAQALQCTSNSDSGSCDCSQYLQSLISLLTTCNQTLSGVSTGLNAVRTSIGDIDPSNEANIVDNLRSIEDSNSNLLELFSYFFEFDQQHTSTPYRLTDFYNLIGSFATAITNARNFVTFPYDVKGRYITTNNPKPRILDFSYWDDLRDEDNEMYRLSLYELLFYGIRDNVFSLASLNNYGATNLYLFSSIDSSLDYIKDSITNKPSVDIWGYVQEVDRSPLDGVSSQYFASLTNEYLRTWSANDNPNTNWFRRVELLLASMVFRDSGHQDELDEIEEVLPSSSDLSTLENSLDPSELFDVDIGGQFFDNAPSLPDFGSQLPQTLVITVPSFGGDDSQSASTAFSIKIDVNSISPLCDAVRACFRFLWWGLVALLVFFLGRWFLKGCSLSFKLIQGIHFS